MINIEINQIKKTIKNNMEEISRRTTRIIPNNTGILPYNLKPQRISNPKINTPKFKRIISNFRIEVREIESASEKTPHFHITTTDESYSIRIKDGSVFKPEHPKYLNKERRKLFKEIWELNYDELVSLWNKYDHVVKIKETTVSEPYFNTLIDYKIAK